MGDGSFTLAPEPHSSSLYITQRIKQFLDGAGLTARMQAIAARVANEDELADYHTREYIAGIRALAEGNGPLQGPWGAAEIDTPLSRCSYESAHNPAGGA